MSIKQADEPPGLKFHRIRAAIAGASATLNLPSPTRGLVVRNQAGVTSRLYLTDADWVAGLRFFEAPANLLFILDASIETLIVQVMAIGSVYVVTKHDALTAADASGEDYVAA